MMEVNCSYLQPEFCSSFLFFRILGKNLNLWIHIKLFSWIFLNRIIVNVHCMYLLYLKLYVLAWDICNMRKKVVQKIILISQMSLVLKNIYALSFYIQFPKCFVPVQIFWASQDLTAFSASSETFLQAQKPILLNEYHLVVWPKMFVTATICK